MINQEELNIANKSYTNKDFASIYPELLELAKKLTNKWDPSTSNESDPGVVLLKLLAFIGDKTNYNIDKNILEAFMPSATQESSMRKLTEMHGYEMQYYNSAVVDVTFMYRGKMREDDEEYFSVNLPAYDTVITSVDESVTYVLLDRVELIDKGVSVTKRAIEGTLHRLRVGGNDLIQVNNLDDNNRIYFPERFVAVNGIFISDTLNNLWERVDNLNTVEPGNTIYKFGFDSTLNLPYVEFPSDVASLIKEGLNIRYIITQGADGNIKANFLSKLYNTTDINSMLTWSSEAAQDTLTASLDDLIISNISASTNGLNPETIDEAYINFKKKVGTFNTLVTAKDYADFIYLLKDSASNYNLVSNIQVADRRTDINYGNNVITFNASGTHVTSNEDREEITPFDLLLYPLNNINYDFDSTSYQNSFRRKFFLDDTLDNAIDEVKTISHDVKNLKDTDIYLYKNYYDLNVRITTTKKVTTGEASSIISNIKNALYRNFNARKVEYGHEIPFDTIYKVIQQADPRIKNVSLDEPNLTTRVMRAGQSFKEVSYLEITEADDSEHTKLLAKNIVAGRVSLFDYFEDFSIEFFTSKVSGKNAVYKHLMDISTEVVIDKSIVAGDGYSLRRNEVIQLIGPNLFTKTAYSGFTNFRYEDSATPKRVIPAGVEYELKSGQTLRMNYMDENDNSVNRVYEAGTIIKTNFDMKDTDSNTAERPADIQKPFGGTMLSMNQTTVNETIEIRDFVSSELNEPWKCYWLLDERKNPLNQLFTSVTNNGSGVYTSEIILSEGEVFLYTDESMTELVILGSGTKLTLQLDTAGDFKLSEWTLDRNLLISKERINDEGLAAFSSLADWRTINFSENKKIEVQEMLINTFGEGVVFKTSTALSRNIDNESQEVASNIKILYKDKNDSDFTEMSQYDLTAYKWELLSRLDINMGPNTTQKVLSGHTISLNYAENKSGANPTPVTITKDGSNDTRLKLSVDLQRAGGEDIDLKVTYFEGSEISSSYDLSALLFNKFDLDEDLNYNEKNNSHVFEIKHYDDGDKLKLPLLSITDKKSLIMFYWNATDETEESPIESITLVDEESIGEIKRYNYSGANPSQLVPGLNIFEVSDVNTITVNIVKKAEEDLITTSDTLLIGPITTINGLNYKQFGFPADSISELTATLLESIKKLGEKVVGQIETSPGEFEDIVQDIFYYNAPLDSSYLIEIDDLSTPEALFDQNNIANKFTLAQINIDSEPTSIKVVKSSLI